MPRENLELLGKTIAAFRKRVGMRQIEVANAVGWVHNVALSEIENGKRLPEPYTLDRLGSVLNLTYADLHFLYGLAGYVRVTTLPPMKQIATALKAYDTELRNHQFPVSIADYRFRTWMMNAACVPFAGDGGNALNRIASQGTTILEGVFNSKMSMRSCILNSEQLEHEYVFNFKIRNLFRRHEPFYMSYPDIMKDRLPDADYRRFCSVWQKVDAQDQVDLFPPRVQLELKVMDVKIRFIAKMGIIPTLQDMFFIHAFEPVSEKDSQKMRKILSQYPISRHTNVCAWDIDESKMWDDHSLTAPSPMFMDSMPD